MLDLVAEQARLEAKMASTGIERFHRLAHEAREGGEASRTKSVQFVIDASIRPLTDAIEDFMGLAKAGKAGRRHSAVKRLAGLDPAAIAFITSKLTLDALHREKSLTWLAVRIGRKIELEQRLAAFAKAKAKEMKAMTKRLDGQTNHEGHRERVYMAMLRFEGDDWKSWSERDQLLVGIKLIELMAGSTGLIEVKTERDRKKTISVVSATPRFKDWLHTLDKQSALLTPYHLPCVIPPKDWTGLTGGGYHTDALAYPLDLVKTRSRAHRLALAKADLTIPMLGLNLVQRTPWQVNKAVLEVAQAIRDSGYEIAGFPPGDDPELPVKPGDIDTNEEARKVWKRSAAKVHQSNRSLTSKRVQLDRVLGVAHEFSKYEAIWFPHQFDFRGRVYAVPQVLNPQGNDLAKGLLRFAEGDPIETAPVQAEFFYHGANCYGVDKETFTDRRAWVEQHHDQILRTAADPLGTLEFWAASDSPFCFLAWAFEYAEWVRSPNTFRNHIALAKDGSCNGLQHYSAMLRDPIGGAATNLIPSDRPQDIYAEVAKVVVEDLERRAELPPLEGDQWADLWLRFGVDRKLTKRPVMVLPYGGTQSSCQKYVLEAASEKIAGGSNVTFGDDLWPASVWMGSRVWDAIGEVVVAARLGMGWLRDVSSVVSKAGLPLMWVTPTGFPVVQAYPEMASRQIKTTLFGQRFDPRVEEAIPNTVDKRRQANGVAPNFVHSLDASALILTVIEAASRGVTKFAMIHDSYGTTAAFTPILSSALRDAFVRMYEENDMLENFRRDVVPPHLAEFVPSPPHVGGLDLSLVRESPYFFA